MLLRIVQLEELERLSGQAIALVDLQEQGVPAFVPEVLSWLKQLEGALEANRSPTSSVVAAQRSRIVSAQRNKVQVRLSTTTGTAARKALSQIAASVLVEVVASVADATRHERARIDEAERLMSAVVAAAHALGMCEQHLTAADNNLVALRAKMAEHPELASALVRVEGLVGPSDCVILLDRILVRYSPTPVSMDGR